MNWIHLTRPEELRAVNEASRQRPVLIFKHSTSCGISAMALARIERAWKPTDDHTTYFIELRKNRDVSNAVEEQYGIRHESPQALIILAGQCVHADSHSGIRYDALVAELERAI